MQRESKQEVVKLGSGESEVTVELYVRYPVEADGDVIIDAVLQAASAVLGRVEPAPDLQLMALPRLHAETV